MAINLSRHKYYLDTTSGLTVNQNNNEIMVYNIIKYQGNTNQNHNDMFEWLLSNLFEWLLSKRRDKCWRGCGEKGTLVQCWWECKLVAATMENSMEVPQKTKHRTTILSSNSTSGYLNERNETIISKKTSAPLYSLQHYLQ